MNIQDIHLIYNYNYWARDRILIAAGQITPAQYEAPAAFPYGSLRSTLLHTLDAEHSWRHMFEFGHWTPDLLESDYPTLPILEEAWLEEEAAMRGLSRPPQRQRPPARRRLHRRHRALTAAASSGTVSSTSSTTAPSTAPRRRRC